MSRRALRTALFAAAVSVVAALSVGSAHAVVNTKASQSCNLGVDYVVACADIRNDIYVFSAPGKVTRTRPIVFWRAHQYGHINSSLWVVPWKTLDVESPIAGGKTGTAMLHGPLKGSGSNEADILFHLPTLSGQAIEYQTVFGVRVDSVRRTHQGCLDAIYVDCTMGPELYQPDASCDCKLSQRVFTMTSRPLDVKIVNSLDRPLIREDGPYWTNALRARLGDDGGTVPAATAEAGPGVANSGALRSIRRTSSYSAVYRVGAGDPDNPSQLAGAMIAINITSQTDGTRKGVCTPLGRPTAPFTCTVEFTGQNAGPVTATVRIRQS